MTIAESHTSFIIERIFLENLKQGIILTADQLEEKLNEYKTLHPDLSKPISTLENFEVVRGMPSSAGQIQLISSYISDDISIVSRTLKDLIGKSQGYYERWNIEIERLLNKARKLEHDIDTLLLLQKDTAGLFAYVGDTFSDMNKIDRTNTDAKLNLKEGTVSINPYNSYPNDSSNGSRIDLSYLGSYDINFNILSTTPVGYSFVTGKESLVKVFKSASTEGDNWVSTVTKNTPGEVAAELKVKLDQNKDTEISRVVFDSSTECTGGNPSITLQWSLDGYQWYMIDDPNPTKSLQNNRVSWVAPITKMRWLKFIIIKNNYDSNIGDTYWYDFGARSIRLYGHQYNIDTSDVLQTIAQQPIDAEGESVTFTKAVFESCETHAFANNGEQLTDIEYFVSASEDGSSDWTEWIQVSPLEREDPNYPSAILFGGSKRLDNMDNNTENSNLLIPFDETKDINKITNEFDWNEPDRKYIGYNFKDLDFAVVNTAIPFKMDPTDIYSRDYNPNYIANTIEVWRNVFDKNSLGTKVRDYNAGWGFENDEYYCSFYIVDSKGITLNFGDTKCIIDGISRTGEVKVYRGRHTFRTKQENWKDFYTSDASYYDVTTEEQLEKKDPLYPYNHKMIIEGYSYNNEYFKGERIYNGVDIVSQYYATKVSAFELENSIEKVDSLKYFAFVKGVGNDDIPSGAILIRRDLNYNDYSDELCRISWKSGEGKYNYLRMRAEFSSNDVTKTSILSSYRIKVGV